MSIPGHTRVPMTLALLGKDERKANAEVARHNNEHDELWQAIAHIIGPASTFTTTIINTITASVYEDDYVPTVVGSVVTLPSTPNPPGSLILAQNGKVLYSVKAGVGDYVLVGNVATLTFTPLVTDKWRGWHRK